MKAEMLHLAANNTSLVGSVDREERSSKPHCRHIAIIGNYPPARCGLATFTQDMADALHTADPGARIDIHALSDGTAEPSASASSGSIRLINANRRSDYVTAGLAIARSGAQVVWVQHEFGIFGGDAGDWLIDLLRPVNAPIVVTLHTILENPSAAQRQVMDWLAGRASMLVVMSKHGAEVLRRVYKVDAARIALIPHGAPDRPRGRSAEMKARFGLAGREVLLTFGLLSPNKGLEIAIAALPAIVAARSDAVYCIAGAVHPKLVEREGEAYRAKLQAQAAQLGVSDRIVWIDHYLETDELLDLIEAADVYLTPYGNEAQSTSGTLTYAVALGKAVISTPYRHAAEMLSDGLGILVPFGDAPAIAAAAVRMLADGALREAMETRAWRNGRSLVWSAFACSTLEVIDRLVGDRAGAAPASGPASAGLRGRFGRDGFDRLCDDTGIMQHSVLGVPDRAHGYCLDDNARALMLAATAPQGSPYAARAWVFAAFVQHAWNPDSGRFRNFMGFDRRWLEQAGSEDSCGRALWALGIVAADGVDADLREWAAGLWRAAVPLTLKLAAPRAMAFALLGADALLRADPGNAAAQRIVAAGAERLYALLAENARPDWQWFEPGLAYDNARLVEALLKAALRQNDRAMLGSALTSAQWLIERQCPPDGPFRPHGTAAFGTPLPDPFDQQAVDAWAIVDLAAALEAHQPDPRWPRAAHAAFAWFFGANDRGMPLVDVITGTCRDGITPHGINRNCGAESILSLLLAERSLARMAQRTLMRRTG